VPLITLGGLEACTDHNSFFYLAVCSKTTASSYTIRGDDFQSLDEVPSLMLDGSKRHRRSLAISERLEKATVCRSSRSGP